MVTFLTATFDKRCAFGLRTGNTYYINIVSRYLEMAFIRHWYIKVLLVFREWKEMNLMHYRLCWQRFENKVKIERQSCLMKHHRLVIVFTSHATKPKTNLQCKMISIQTANVRAKQFRACLLQTKLSRSLSIPIVPTTNTNL